MKINNRCHSNGNTRVIKFHCDFCKCDFEEEIEFGSFVDFSQGTHLEVYIERQGIKDIYSYSIVCNICGCASGLKML